MEKLQAFTSKTFLKMVSGRMHTPHPTPLDPPLAISYSNYQKSVVYFSHSAPLILFYFTKRRSETEGVHDTMTPFKCAPASNLLV